mmetsp:Transcript_95297/g.142812  ORF Transcript_95297/g.142812 Transcript_95297/m.142812 type:complete len:361 (+) Transcript_95297:123-1205(+)
MRWSFAFVACLASWGCTQVDAFVLPNRISQNIAPQLSLQANGPLSANLRRDVNAGFRLSSTAETTADAEAQISDDEWTVITRLYSKADSDDGASLDQVVLEALPTLNPTLIMKLRGAVEDPREEFKAVADAMNNILDTRLEQARDLLTDLLNAGEIRKLDAMIGKAAREGRLDVAFFQVLNMNLQDAASKSPTESDALADENANRFQIMQHVYTRCQEEVEKTIPPGVALLNKLLRTEVNSIRQNQLNHYMCPQPNVIKSPDGKEIELKGGGKILVPHQDFVDALANSIKQIRTVEQAGGATREMAANMVEACRTVAKEARVVIGEHFGRDSEELIKYEEGLQPVFRPESPESPYMKGDE